MKKAYSERMSGAILTHRPVKEFEDRYNFRTYEELFDFYKEVKNYTEFREKFLRL